MLRKAVKRLVRAAYWALGGYEGDPELDSLIRRAFIEGHVTDNHKFPGVDKARAEETERKRWS